MLPRRSQPLPCFALGWSWRQYRCQCPPMPTNALQCPPMPTNAHQWCSAMPLQCPQQCDAISQLCPRLKSSCTLTNGFCRDTVKDGVLPPWEVAKAYAFHIVVKDVSEILGERPAVLPGKRMVEHVATKVCITGWWPPLNTCHPPAPRQLCRFLMVPWAYFRGVSGQAARIF